MKKRILTVLLAVCLVFALGTVTALATDGETSTESTGAVLYNGVAYDTLADAVAVIHQFTGTERMNEHVIQLTDDVTCGGFAAGYATILNGTTDGNSPVNITVNLGGHTYTVTNPTVGSSGTETNGFQFLKGSKVTFENGKIVSSLGNLLFQNYCDLTFNNVDITATNASYVISNNCGEMNLLGNSSITAGAGKNAFDVCWWPASYSEGVDVTIDTTGTITGNIELGTYGKIDENPNANNTLTIENVVFNGEIVATQNMTSQAKNIVTITGGNFSNSESAKDYLAPGLDIDEDGKVVVGPDAVAKVGDTVYTDLQEAIDEAQSGTTKTVTLLKDVSVSAADFVNNQGAITITGNIILDGDTHTISITSIDTGATPSAINIQNSANVTLKDLTIDSNGAKHGLNINDAGTVELEDVEIMNSAWYAVVCNNSKLTVDGLYTHDNQWGVNVDKGSTATFNDATISEEYSVVVGEDDGKKSTVELNDGSYNVIQVKVNNAKVDIDNGTYDSIELGNNVSDNVVDVNGGNFDENVDRFATVDYVVSGSRGYTYFNEFDDAVAYAGVGDDIDFIGSSTTRTHTVRFYYENNVYDVYEVVDDDEVELPTGQYDGKRIDGWKRDDGKVFKPGDDVTITRNTDFTVILRTAAYDIVIDDDILHGDIWTSPKSEAEDGDTVHVYADPDAGYVLEDLSVTYRSGRYELKLTRVSANHYTFTMPAHDVYVTAEFTSDGFPFDDVRSNQWFYDAVYYVWANDLMEGVDYDEFNPNGTMTRAMFWAVLGRIDGETITGTNWADEARDWAMSEGVSDGTDPNGLVTREQMVTMLWRYAGERDGSGNLSRYTDGDKVAQYATEAMRWALGNGIIEGTTATTLEPQATATRAQCAAIFMRYYE